MTDALDINWSALISDSRTCPSPSHGSALKRLRPLNFLSRLGVSTKYARPDVLQRVTDECLRIEEMKNETEVKTKIKKSNSENLTENGVESSPVLEGDEKDDGKSDELKKGMIIFYKEVILTLFTSICVMCATGEMIFDYPSLYEGKDLEVYYICMLTVCIERV